jgi:hypothetical protein
MSGELKRNYFAFLIPSILGFAFAYWAKANGFIEIDAINYLEIIAPSIFILSAISAVAFPIFYRALFAHRRRKFICVSEEELFQFERTLIYVVMTTPYLALTAYVREFPSFYTTGAILMGLYAVYYFYPSNRRVAFERRIFRVK